MSTENSLAHTKWECKYHIVFAPKYRRQVIYKQIKADVGQILGTLCRRKGIEIIEAEACPDHIHMLVRIPPKYSVSEIMGYLKGKSSLMIFEKHANLKWKYGNRHFADGTFVQWDLTFPAVSSSMRAAAEARIGSWPA
jgi:REP element-mobilizing transposase RayT